MWIDRLMDVWMDTTTTILEVVLVEVVVVLEVVLILISVVS